MFSLSDYKDLHLTHLTKSVFLKAMEMVAPLSPCAICFKHRLKTARKQQVIIIVLKVYENLYAIQMVYHYINSFDRDCEITN